MSEQKPKVLIVDDVEANLLSLEAVLDDLDCELIRATSGNQALKELLKNEFAVLLLDVQMPGIDGFEVARYVHSNPSTRETPIIFLTAVHDTEESVLRGYDTGAVDFLRKPIDTQVLRAKVRVFLALYESRQKLVREVAAHQRTLAALERANAALRHFTDAASHDLKAPVRSVRGFLQALQEDVGPTLDAQARDYLDRSIRSAERMDTLLDSLLRYARLQRSGATMSVSCDGLVEQIRTELREELARTSATLEATSLPEVQGDPDRIYQLLHNLVTNALKFRRPDVEPRIRISSEQRGNEWVFCVEDNGIGIDSAHLSRVFQPFFRSGTEGKYRGSGLGLAICQQVVEQHHGRIWVESELGRGSRFYFALPLA